MATANSRMKIGEKNWRLTAKEYLGKGLWRFECSCGNEKVNLASTVRGGKVKSCGCLLKEHGKKVGKSKITHGLSNTRTYQTWKSMRNRCSNPNNAAYKYYGGRGISVCDRWERSFQNFLTDMGDRPEGCSIDRIDSDKDYDPSNCRWSSLEEQYENRRNNNQFTANERRVKTNG